MLLDQATPGNVARALGEINSFEWEGDFKPMARQALRGAFGEAAGRRDGGVFGSCLAMSTRPIGHDYRNGHYVRHLLTEMGDLELLVPRSRKRRFPTKLFERYARRCRSVDKVLLACFCLGLSTRKAASVLAPVLGEKVSAATISRIARDLDQEVSRYHGRALGG